MVVAILVNIVQLDFVRGNVVVKFPMETESVEFVSISINISNVTDIKVIMQIYHILCHNIVSGRLQYKYQFTCCSFGHYCCCVWYS